MKRLLCREGDWKQPPSLALLSGLEKRVILSLQVGQGILGWTRRRPCQGKLKPFERDEGRNGFGSKEKPRGGVAEGDLWAKQRGRGCYGMLKVRGWEGGRRGGEMERSLEESLLILWMDDIFLLPLRKVALALRKSRTRIRGSRQLEYSTTSAVPRWVV